MRPLLGRLAHDCPSSGVTGNPIRAYTDPGGSDPLAESLASGFDPPRIDFTSGFDPSPRKRSVFGASISSRKITSCHGV